MIDETKERQAFERWYTEHYKYIRLVARKERFHEYAYYIFQPAQSAWETWLKKAELGMPNGTDRPN